MMKQQMLQELQAAQQLIDKLRLRLEAMPEPKKAWFTAKEAASLVGMKHDTVLKYCREERFQSARRTSGGWFIHRDELAEYNPNL